MAEPANTTPAASNDAQITPPFAYGEIVPLNKAHRVLVPQRGKITPAFRNLNALPVSLVEFPLVARDYAIVFATADAGKTYVVFAVLGLEAQSNLFLMSDNTWDRRAYLPAYVRRYPFCMATITVDGKLRDERLVCVEKKALRDKGDRLFDDAGTPLPEWERQQKLLIEYEADLQRTNEMAATLAGLGLLEPFTMQARPNEGPPIALSGMARVSEEKLGQLEGEKLKELMHKGYLARIYAHMGSLDNFQRLLDRRASLAARQLQQHA
ncbi:MAG: SapC family protein [Burkholderiales bacterium]|nr:SapC family protein [Burkholderiales bacterium]